jgi:DNA-binding MarR family transcriptional regulator
MSNKNMELAAELRTVVTRLIKKLRKESATSQQLSLTERTTLALLQNGGMLPSELAAAEKITNQSMSQILVHLLEVGFINRTGSTTDKRKVIITLTEKGNEIIEQVRHEREEWLAEAIEQVCTKEEQHILKQALAPLSKIVDFK